MKKNDLNRRETLKKIIAKGKRYLHYFIISLISAVVSVAANLMIPLLIGDAVDCIKTTGNVDFATISKYLLFIGLSLGVSALAQYLMGLCSNRMTYGITRDIRDEAFRHIQKLPLSYLDSHATGDTVSRMISDVEHVADGLLLGFTHFFTGILTILGALGFR